MTVVELLDRIGKEKVEPGLRPYLFLAGGYLPQAWVFKTESEVSTLMVEKSGNTKGLEGAAKNPDVVVEWSEAQLSAALRVGLGEGDRNSVQRDPPPRVETLTSKGQLAFSLLRNQIGL